ncbi:High-affinity branched-chain amino acid transport system permease protein LivH [bioreactor metagenome]|jgi:branched-chain amino acid transport system permease protein|uniref:Branched-chain amino acid ABC transporter permease n=2 Tax=root TaxID=1 RepID=A0AAN0KDZ5_9ACTN|nr:branched-chain amino acid ABC transporter permease [Brooklawnia sp. SH051]MCB0884694.1 branched-chain amino acid ABC transporter permease [Propionibacteriaceae bacterium]MEA5120805.1 branched-chain amino acid ABC transporter permease [Propionibacterium sp.]NLI86536.1 branched-chain amino acid ABC transporter permease [Propionibacterium sp.]BEH00773.1 branched-chain amino acid ABC transporter permease [Brooklawnia sp. SH051]
MDQILQQLINGLSLGSIYALIALGYTMVYGIIQLINFAHGDVYMVGAYVGYVCMAHFHLGFFTSLIVAMAVCAVLGMVIERVAYKPLRNSTRIAVLITAIGVSLLLEYTMMYFAGAEVRTYPPMPGFMSGSYHLGGVTVTALQLMIIAISVLLMVALQFIVKRTRLGRAMRAVSQDADAARLMGISVDNTISFTFALGSALAGAAGVLVGVYYNSINPLMGILPGLKAFVAAVLGGIGLIPGALIGGYLIGTMEVVVSGLGFSTYRDAAVFAILILVLIVKPSGLLGKNVREKV